MPKGLDKRNFNPQNRLRGKKKPKNGDRPFSISGVQGDLSAVRCEGEDRGNTEIISTFWRRMGKYYLI